MYTSLPVNRGCCCSTMFAQSCLFQDGLQINSKLNKLFDGFTLCLVNRAWKDCKSKQKDCNSTIFCAKI